MTRRSRAANQNRASAAMAELWSCVYPNVEDERVREYSRSVAATARGKIQHFMDSRGACKEVSDELARELLIAISYPVPDQVLDLSFVPRDRVLVANGDGDEKYVSELMTISNVQSPDIKNLKQASICN